MRNRILLRIISYFLPTFLATFYVWYWWNPIWFNQFCAIHCLLIISWTLGYYFFEIYNQTKINPKNKIVLVTGCDTGFGNRLVIKLDALGFHVYAGVLYPDGDGAQELQRQCSNRLKILRMDVTSEQEVNQVVEQIEKSGLPLWGIVNNAGVGFSVPFDWGKDIDVYKRTFEVNIFGVIRVTKKCSRLLRESRGRIVNVASVAGRMPAPFIGHYSMAKHSVRVFSDVLRRELYATGIKVITLEPSFYRTEIINWEAQKRMRAKVFSETPEEIRGYYGENFLEYLNETHGLIDKNTRTNIDEVVDAMVKGLILKYPKIYYRCGSWHELFTLWAASHLPEILLDVATATVLDMNLLKYKAGRYQDHKSD